MAPAITVPDSCGKDNDSLKQTAVVVCTDTHTFAGFTYCAYGQRLLDTLNEGLTVDGSLVGKYFLPLTQVEVFLPDGRKENVASTYVSKSNILFVAGRSESQYAILPTQPSHSTYPFREKAAVGAKVRFPQYTLTGKMHNDVWELLIDTLEGDDKFLPVTNVEILPQLVNGESQFDFVAINKDQIIYVAQL